MFSAKGKRLKETFVIGQQYVQTEIRFFVLDGCRAIMGNH